jgi:alkylation response protein AidB-like acyl-CoA dehydrogenase
VDDLMDAAVRWTERDAVDFESTVTPESLAAIMRATGTLHDRALRRDLSQLLVALGVSRAIELTTPGSLAIAGPVRRMTRQRKLARVATFLSHVLGPRLIADTGQPNTFDLADAVLAVPSPRLLAEDERAPLLAVAEHVLNWQRPSQAAVAAHAGTAVPKEFDGAGGGPCEIGEIQESLGMRPASSPFFATAVLSVYALLEAGGDTGALLSAIASGATTATLAAVEGDGRWDPAGTACHATPDGAGWRLDGEKSFVLDATTADLLLVIARKSAGPALFAVGADARAVDVVPMAVIDPTRPMAQVRLRGAPARLLTSDGSAVLSRVLDLGALALAAEQVGTAQSCLDLAVAGLSEPDESALVAIAELYLLVTAARAIASDAAEQATHDGPGAAAAATRAHICCSQVAVTVARRALRVIGEPAIENGHPLQALYRRAIASELLFGGPVVSHERLLRQLGI